MNQGYLPLLYSEFQSTYIGMHFLTLPGRKEP